VIQDCGGRHLELWLLRLVLNQSSNIPAKFGDDWSNSKEMASVFRNSNGGSHRLEKYTSG